MIEDIFVIDAVTHGYDLRPENIIPPSSLDRRAAEAWSKMTAMGHLALSAPGYGLQPDQFCTDWTARELLGALFVESPTDMAVHHVIPMRGLFHEEVCSLHRTKELKELAPHRILTYAGIDPLLGRAGLEQLDQQVEILGDPLGIKLYPVGYAAGGKLQGWLMNDPKIAYPIFEKARELGIKVVAVHKASPIGISPMKYFKIDDVDEAAGDFPDLIFEIVHGGVAFAEETNIQLRRFPNVIINLETASGLLVVRPRAFERILAGFKAAGPAAFARVCWGTGCVAVHPRPALEAFMRFEFSQAALDEFEIEQITHAEKRAILGENFARVHGLGISTLSARCAGDEFEIRRASWDGVPWSTTRARKAEEA